MVNQIYQPARQVYTEGTTTPSYTVTEQKGDRVMVSGLGQPELDLGMVLRFTTDTLGVVIQKIGVVYAVLLTGPETVVSGTKIEFLD